MFKCLIYNKVFKSLNGLSHHITKTENMAIEDYYNTYLKTHENEGICPVCGNPTRFIGLNHGYTEHCSISCSHLNPKTQETYKQTMLDRHGVTNMFSVNQVQEKAHTTMHSTKNKITKQQKYFEKHGVNHSTQNPEVIKKMQQTRLNNINRFELENDCILMKTVDKMVNGNIWKKHLNIPRLQLGRDKFIERKYLPEIIEYMEWFEENRYKGISAKEKEITEAVKNSYRGVLIENTKSIISPYELDIYLPDLNLAIEFNGKHFHSAQLKGKDYHYKKSKLCREKGIRLIHIYEFENIKIQKELLISLLNGIDKYPKNDFNKNNLLENWDKVKLEEIYNDNYDVVYGVGKLITK